MVPLVRVLVSMGWLYMWGHYPEKAEKCQTRRNKAGSNDPAAGGATLKPPEVVWYNCNVIRLLAVGSLYKRMDAAGVEIPFCIREFEMIKMVGKRRTSSAKQNTSMRERTTQYAVPRSFYWMPITEDKIREAAERIVRATHPQTIILFGSYAYGKPTADSDVDLLVVMDSTKSAHARMVEVSDILYPRPFPVDIIVRTPDELQEQLKAGDPFFHEIVAKGRVLYERTSRRAVDQKSGR